MALYTTEDVGNISFQQPVSQPSVPSSISTKGTAVNAVADIVGGLAPGIQAALNNRNPLDDFAEELSGELKSVPTTSKGTVQRERKIKQTWLDFSINNPELADDAAALVGATTGYDLTMPSPQQALRNDRQQFFNNNPSLYLNAVVKGSDGQVDPVATDNKLDEIYHRELNKKAKARERQARLDALELGNKERDELVKSTRATLSVDWAQDSQEKIRGLESFIDQAEGPQQALQEIRQRRQEAIFSYQTEAAENGLTPDEVKDEIAQVEAYFTRIETTIEENLGDFDTMRKAIENASKLRFGKSVASVIGDLGNTPEGRKAVAEILAEAGQTELKAMELIAEGGLPAAANLSGWGTLDEPGNPDEETTEKQRQSLSDTSDDTSVTGATEGPRTAVSAGGVGAGPVRKPSSQDVLSVNSKILGQIRVDQPGGPEAAKNSLVQIVNTAAALRKPMSSNTLQTVLSDKNMEVLNRSSQLNDVVSQQNVEAIQNFGVNQMNLAIRAAESRLNNLPKGMGVVYENKQFRLDVTGRISWGDKVAETDAETEGYVVVQDGKVSAIMGGPGVADVPSGRGVTVIPLKNTGDATFVSREVNKINDTLKAANYLSRRMERVTGIRDEWRDSVDNSFERFAPKAPESAPMPENIKLNEAMKPLVNSMEGASELTRPYAAARMNAVLSGPFQQLQETFGSPLTINDAIAKSGTSREKNTPGSRHFHGDALDIDVSGMSDAEKLKLVDSALKAGFQGFGFGNNILHVDMGKPRAWNYNNETFGGRPVGELIEGVRGNVRGLPDLPMVDTGQQPTDEEEMGMEADPREGRPTNFIEFALPNRRDDDPDAMTSAPSAPPAGQQIANDSVRGVAPTQVDAREPGREAPGRPEGEPEEQNKLARQVQEQQMDRALQALQKLGVDPSQIPAFNSVEDAQRAIDNGVLSEGDLYEVNGEIEVVEGA